MLLKTHLMFALFLIILFISHVENKIIFVVMIVIATILPDLDTGFSTFGKSVFARPIQLFVRHRGIIHSFTSAILFSIFLAIFLPVTSLGFFVGYSLHLITDSFTKEGIQPFWPIKAKSSGMIRSGGRVEEGIFFSLIFINIIMIIFLFFL